MSQAAQHVTKMLLKEANLRNLVVAYLALIIFTACTNSDSLDLKQETFAMHDDGDGVPRDQDLCPGSGEGEQVNADGCSMEQIDEQGNPIEQNAAFTTFVIDALSKAPIVFRTLSTNVKSAPGRFVVTGTLLLSTPLGHVKLLEVEAVLESPTGDPLRIEALTGTARVPFPEISFLDQFEMPAPLEVSLGIDYGRNLRDIGIVRVPIQDDARYVFLDTRASLSKGSTQFGPFGGCPGFAAHQTFVIDPTDPMFYAAGNFAGMDFILPDQCVGLGLSLQGRIPFVPDQAPKGVEGIGPFDGHVYLGGSVMVPKLLLRLEGETTVDLDPQNDGIQMFPDALADRQLGANGFVLFQLPLVGLRIPLVSASTIAQLSASANWAYLSGEFEPQLDWIPDFVPQFQVANSEVEAYVSDNIRESYLVAVGEFSIDFTDLGHELGLDLEIVSANDMSLRISKDGFDFTGTSDKGFSPLFEYHDGISIDAHFAGENDWYVEMRGEMSLGGIGLSSQAVARLSSKGIEVQGRVDTGIGHVAISGSINKAGINIRGFADVSIDVIAGRKVLETVVDGSLCGYAVVRNGALCGYETVTDGAICGFQTVTNGAVCGYETVTDAVRCGIETFGCWLKPWKWGTCSRARTCDIESSCDIPRTCKDLSAPRTCTDWSQPLSCEHEVTIPDYFWGEFRGMVEVSVGNTGLEGEVSGTFCPVDSACAHLTGGQLKIGEKLEACVKIPELGEFCAPF